MEIFKGDRDLLLQNGRSRSILTHSPAASADAANLSATALPISAT
ncbi:hypothetical protein [Oscillatoria nigro-viridis]|nr:hypothetical protein [Oscillatoria nigro-viridis]